jgi:hypothetical protein
MIGPAAVVRSAAAALAGIAGVVSVLIVFNLASFGSVELQRLREPSLVGWLCVLVVLLARSDRGEVWSRWTSTIADRFGSRRCFWVVAVVGGVSILASSLTHHLAFDTYSHDLGMYQEALENAWGDPPLASGILGSSFLGEHFSPVLFLLAPIYQLIPSPLTLVALNALILWVGVFPLAAVGRRLELADGVTNLVCLVYLFFPVIARSAGYPFHHEVLYPLVLISLYLAFLRDAKWVAVPLIVAALAIKEDAGLYLVGMGLFFGLHHRRWRWGCAVGVVGLVSTVVAVVWLIPHFAGGTAGYGFHGRWAAWLRPDEWDVAVKTMATALFTEDVITVIVATLLVPFRGRWTWTVAVIPFLLNLTSSTANQAQLGLYYGLPVAATAAIASLAALADRPFDRRQGLKLAAAAIVINVAAFTYPSIPPCRSEVVAELDAIDRSAAVAMSASFDPLLQRVPNRRLIRAGERPSAEVVVLRIDRFTWPLGRDDAAELAATLDRDPAYDTRFKCDGFVVFERRTGAEGP